MEIQLEIAGRRSHCSRSLVRDIAEIGIRNTGVGVSVASDVERVEGVRTETDGGSFGNVEVLEDGIVDLPVAGAAFAAVAGRTEAVVGRDSVGAGAVVHARRRAGRSRGIGAPPVVDVAAHDLELAILVCALLTEA